LGSQVGRKVVISVVLKSINLEIPGMAYNTPPQLGTVTQYDVLVGDANNKIVSIGPGSAGQVLRSGGNAANPAYSTATYPSTAGTANNVLTSDGTNWTSATAPGAGLLSVSGQLTSAQIKSLHGTPIVVIAAPGSGFYIAVFLASGSYVYGGNNAFTAGAAQTITLTYGATANAGIASPLVSNAVLVATASKLELINSSLTEFNPANYNNMSLNLYNTVATEITGNAANDNVLNYTIIYKIIAL
jgi:hypothetical protein